MLEFCHLYSFTTATASSFQSFISNSDIFDEVQKHEVPAMDEHSEFYI